MAWKAIVHSAIGTRHEQRGQPCQDYGNYRIEGPYLIGAVSDGAGSAKYAEVGAQIAVESTLEAIALALAGKFSLLTNGRQSLPCQDMKQIADLLFHEVVEAVVAALRTEAEGCGCELKDLGCTLLAFVASPDWVAAMQIGDGFMVMRCSETDPYQLLFEPDKGEFINETIFVTSHRAIDYMKVCVEPSLTPFVCAATDGLERVAIRMQDWQPFAPFFMPFEACLSKLPNQIERDDYLKTFLESDRLNAKTDDDKTLLACLYSMDKWEGYDTIA